jgi:transketolase
VFRDSGQGKLRRLAVMLCYVPEDELVRLRDLPCGAVQRAAAFADACRINALYMIARAGSGHVGTSFSCMDILAWLHLGILRPGDRYFSSKGHDAPALYSVLLGTGELPFERIHTLRRLDGLPGHPDVAATPPVNTSTGSLGMGISKARGFARAGRMRGRAGRVFVLTGDGELQEGQFWEALEPTANGGFGEITAIVDHNKLQSDTFVSQVSDLGDLERKVAAFGWAVGRCDGNDIAALAQSLAALQTETRRPKLLVADTLKGAGVSFMEPHELPEEGTALYPFHSGAPSPEEYARALAELEERLTAKLDALGVPAVELAAVAAPPRTVAGPRAQRLVAAYGEALVHEAGREPRLVALDADLVLDTGLVPFRERFADRFVECGIAEQDMVSQAGAMALAGLLPVCHSFACFLTTRANEQIYNNTTEGSKVLYAGSLAGLVPGGPGHSHQSVRDIALLASMPGMTLIEPYSEDETRLALHWAVREASGPVYLRLVSVPWELGFVPPAHAGLVRGRGALLRDGDDALFVATGPVMVSQAWKAADLLAGSGLACGLVALPWLNAIDGGWLAALAAGRPLLCVDNHYVVGGQGDAVLAAVEGAVPVHKLGVDRVPECGTNDEVLRAHRLDAQGLAGRVRAALPVRA